MNALAPIFTPHPSAGTPRHVATRDMGPEAAFAPCLAPSGEAGSRGAPAGGHAVSIGLERPADVARREALLDSAMGPGRRRKSSEKLRRGRRPSEGLAFVARDQAGRIVGTVRLWDVSAGEGGPAALLLGPLAVDPALKSAGIGSSLMRHAIDEASRLGHRAILLVGDAPYYSRFGFSAERTGALSMPGPYERERFLALELADGALDGASGVLTATGRRTRPARGRICDGASFEPSL